MTLTPGAIEIKKDGIVLARSAWQYDEPLGLEEIRFIGFPVKFVIPLQFTQGDTLTITFSNPKEPR